MKLSKIFTIFLVSILALNFYSVSVYANVKDMALVDVPRPRLILSQEHLLRIKAEVRSTSLIDYKELLAYARWRSQSTSPDKLALHNYQPEVILPISLAALISEDDQLISYATNSIVHLAGISATTGDDTEQRFRLLSLSFGYDWLYRFFTPVQRKKVVDSISCHIRLLSYFADTPKFTGGHDRFGSITLLAGVVAIVGEKDSESNDLLIARLRKHWSDGFNPFQAYAARDGGYVMGWQYGAGYTSLWPYLIGERLGFDWLNVDWIRDLPLWYLYGLRGDGTFPRMGDCNDCRVGQHLAQLMAYASSRWSDGRAEWFYRSRLGSLWGPYRIWRIIFPGVRKATPPNSEKALPLARHFSGSGVIVARDAWDETSTHLVFKSSPYYSLNHQHKDQNHFELSYQGSLLVDSGCYDRYGSSHWQNYYTRTIAHNTLVVFSEREKYILNGKVISNDGGQIFREFSILPRGEEPADLAETLTDKYQLDGITGFVGSTKGAWMQGDATKAYDKRVVKSYLRDIVMVYRPQGRSHPLLLILDRVSLVSKFTPRILFHSNGKPVVTERNFTLANPAGGLLHGEFFGSDDLHINLVGGPGQEWLVNGINYPPERICSGAEVSDLGSWRLEVGPINPVGAMELLTVLAIDNSAAVEGEPKMVQVSGEGYRGVIVGKDLVIIAYSTSKKYWSFEGPQFDAIDRMILAGTIENPVVQINGQTISVFILARESVKLN